jgi:undecaprenyl-diphosphatase
MSRFAHPLQRLAAWDESWCVRFNRASRIGAVRSVLRLASRLGDGVFWYALMLGLLIADGRAAVGPVLKMALAGATGTLVYKLLKGRMLRPRPYQVNHAIALGVAPLDQFSFPSGHTLHAVCFTVVALAHYPTLAWLLIPFTLVVAASRPVLGVHYPSDVLAGGLIGALIGMLAIRFIV